MYERNEKLYKHKISQMEKVIPLVQYEPLVLTLKSETLNEEKERGQIDGARPLDKNNRGVTSRPQKRKG
jgi:hypothetical protein